MVMVLPEFVFLKSKALDGTDLILQTDNFLSVFRVFWFANNTHLENFIKKHNIYGDCVQVPGYNILLCFVGSIKEIHETPVKGPLIHKIKVELPKLLQFYISERVKGNESRIKKYLVQ